MTAPDSGPATHQQADAKPVVLCVDDEPSILKSLQRLLVGQQLQVLTATSGSEALEKLKQQPVHVIISDMRMPQMSGAEFLRQASLLCPDAQRILLTGYADIESTIAAINDGKIHRYVQKPWRNDELLALVQEGVEKQRLLLKNQQLQRKVALQNEKLRELNSGLELQVEKRTVQLRKVLKQMQSEHEALVELLFNFIIVNPKLNGQFAQSVAHLARILAIQAGLDETQQKTIRRAALLHQLGLLGMDPDLYSKAFYLMDSGEKQQYCTHPALAQLMLLPAPSLIPLSDAIYHQYERYNGSGTPDGLVGVDIPVSARILALARDYMLLIEQCGTERFDLACQQSLAQIQKLKGSHYDPELVDTLLMIKVDQLKAQTTQGAGHLNVQSEDLVAGMLLERPLFSDSKILLLPHGHVFTNGSIEKLRQIERKRGKKFSLLVTTPKATQEVEHG